MLTPLQKLLLEFRETAHSKTNSAFKQLIIQYISTEPYYKDLYREVLPYAEWHKKYGKFLKLLPSKDTSIDLIAVTEDYEYHAVQCKNFHNHHKILPTDINDFLISANEDYFTHKIIVATTDYWSPEARQMLEEDNQQPSLISLNALEVSVIDWEKFELSTNTVEMKRLKKLWLHQHLALNDISRGLKYHDRGKLIMPHNTGKTYISLKLSEEVAGRGKSVLFLTSTPSLLAQAVIEWGRESNTLIQNYIICSESEEAEYHQQLKSNISDKVYPTVITAASLLALLSETRSTKEPMLMIFATYQSLEMVHNAQKKFNMSNFDLMICDEAEEILPSTFSTKNSHSKTPHNNDYITAIKRLYMLTPQHIYNDNFQKIEEIDPNTINDTDLLGEAFHIVTCAEAQLRGLVVPDLREEATHDSNLLH